MQCIFYMLTAMESGWVFELMCTYDVTMFLSPVLKAVIKLMMDLTISGV